MNKIVKNVIWLVMLAPIVYLLFIWKSLPDTIALHFDMNGNPDRYGSKNELLGVVALMAGVTVGTYLLMRNIHRIDPKRYAKEMQDKYTKMGVVIALFLSALHFFVIYSAAKGRISASPGVIFAGISVLLAIIGNYMYNLKPNYFVGIRVPWTLANDDNWKKTHQMAARLWFFAGLALAALSLTLPPRTAMIVFFGGVFLITIIPIVYSYTLFAKEKNNK